MRLMDRRGNGIVRLGQPDTADGYWQQQYQVVGELIEPHPNGCWLWTGHLSPTGYGITPSGVAAHRFVYETLTNEDIEGLVLHHHCETRRCVNPEHLEPMENGEHLKAIGQSL